MIPEFIGDLGVKNRRATRLDLAKWVVSRNNPLTARTFVNRLWALYFGTGISRVLDDLGAQGEPPVHSDLLDWLAVEFMESGWNVKTHGENSLFPQTPIANLQNRMKSCAKKTPTTALLHASHAGDLTQKSCATMPYC